MRRIGQAIFETSVAWRVAAVLQDAGQPDHAVETRARPLGRIERGHRAETCASGDHGLRTVISQIVRGAMYVLPRIPERSSLVGEGLIAILGELPGE